MLILKKLTFAPLFLISLILLIYNLAPLLKTYDLIFSLSANNLIQLVIISALISMSSFLFVLFSIFSLNWKLILPVGIFGSLIPMAFVNQSLGLLMSTGILVSLVLSYINLDNIMNTYLTFQPISLLGPPIRRLCSFLIITFSIVYFLGINKVVTEIGFQIPDSLIDTALKIAQPAGSSQLQTTMPELSIPEQQLEMLKKNPDILKQSGLDPTILDTLNQPEKVSSGQTSELIKKTVNDQIQSFLKPYLSFIPALLAILLFLTFQSLASIVNLLIYPLLWLVFYILEKSRFVKFEIEQRPVKKMVI
ncbi:hypothetical protein HY384_04410 [Candidatus Daviesbacteria bacterium]|nr:hypothetical protein [Candidatus Daviesbacteria bacterium]